MVLNATVRYWYFAPLNAGVIIEQNRKRVNLVAKTLLQKMLVWKNVVSGNGGFYRWVTLGPPPPNLIERRPTPANRWGTNNWSIGNTSVFPGHSRWRLFDVFDWNITVTSIQVNPHSIGPIQDNFE
ncbi:Hypothetical predicted protein [Mytilus galloprovincialis]|uniref:Uncharacterized protein n=1 Tax=Mytilus galloprovincialis TaxID=29158 RepID=A0A8B6CWA0_MYTGA|nr:Hypothetical predicted protein [Mytilus galloprovincialis]